MPLPCGIIVHGMTAIPLVYHFRILHPPSLYGGLIWDCNAYGNCLKHGDGVLQYRRTASLGWLYLWKRFRHGDLNFFIHAPEKNGTWPSVSAWPWLFLPTGAIFGRNLSSLHVNGSSVFYGNSASTAGGKIFADSTDRGNHYSSWRRSIGPCSNFIGKSTGHHHAPDYNQPTVDVHSIRQAQFLPRVRRIPQWQTRQPSSSTRPARLGVRNRSRESHLFFHGM